MAIYKPQVEEKLTNKLLQMSAKKVGGACNRDFTCFGRGYKSLLPMKIISYFKWLVQQTVSSVTNKSVIPEVFYRESIAEYGFPIKDFGNDELLLGYEHTGCCTSF